MAKAQTKTATENKWESILRGSLLSTIMNKNIQYVARADSRAQIMIAISSFIVPIAFTGIEHSVYQTAALVAIITAIGTIGSSIWVLFPKIYQCKNHPHHNLLHFSQAARMPEEEFVQKMHIATTETGMLTKMVVQDFYHMSSRVLAPKFFWLRVSYTIFLVGNVLAICTALISIGLL